MKTKKIVGILILSAFVLALTRRPVLAQAAAPEVKKKPREPRSSRGRSIT